MTGVVKSFDPNTLRGVVIVDGAELRFHSTSFQADSAFRWPRVGERVEIVKNHAGDLLSVHGT